MSYYSFPDDSDASVDDRSVFFDDNCISSDGSSPPFEDVDDFDSPTDPVLPSTDSGVSEEPVQEGTFWGQFLAVVERVVRQSLRKKCALFLEMFIPILFVIITAALSLMWGIEDVPERQYVDYANPGNNTETGLYSFVTCYNASGGNFIRGVQSCEIAWFDVTCEGDESGLPVKGLCYAVDFREVGPASLWLYAFGRSMWRIPELDDVIMYQWLTRKVPVESQFVNLLTSGLFVSSRLSAIRSTGRLYFVGSGLDGLVDYFKARSLFFEYVSGGTYETLEDAYDVLRSSNDNWAIVEVVSLTEDNFDVVVHLNSTALPPLSLVQDPSYAGGYATERAELYAVSGFLSIQQLVSEYYLSSVAGNGQGLAAPRAHFFVPFGFPEFIHVPILANTGPLLPFMYVLAFLYPVSQLTKKIVLEKETRVREAMLIMGLSNAPIYMSWYVVYTVEYAIVCLLMVGLMSLMYMARSDPYVVFFLFFYYAISTIPLSGLLATFFSKARLASLLSPLIYLVMAVPVFAVTNGSGWLTTVFCLFSPTAFSVLMIALVQHELGGGFRTQFNSHLDSPTMLVTVLMLTLDFFLYNVLMLYFDAVLPKDWGTPKHPLFFII
ncbi:ATP-binding cassette protein subfamily A, member 5, partial [Trypanosoma grayi]|uniref:ATP-binding cassette protein subfamily A, member 5 n=1 Tax=Trypanosoma grayi TaxID=71804 RepID=UPI0004F4A745